MPPCDVPPLGRSSEAGAGAATVPRATLAHVAGQPTAHPAPHTGGHSAAHERAHARAVARVQARLHDKARVRRLVEGRIPLWLPILLGFLTAAGPLSTDAYLPAFPAIESGLHGARGSAQATLAAWFGGLACGQIVMGPLSDRFGRRLPLLLGTVLFTLASVGCALAWSIPSETTFRFFAAFGASASAVVPRAIVRDLRDGQEARRLMAQLILVTGAVPILAPSLGGALLVVASWRLIFWIAAGYGLLALVLIWFALPDTLPHGRRIRIRVQVQLMRYVSILFDRGFATNAGISGLAAFSLFAYLGGSPIALVREYGLSPAQYALAYSVNAGVFITAAQCTAPLAGRIGVDRLLRHGTAWFVVTSLFLLGVTASRVGGLPLLLLAIAFTMAAMGLMTPIAPVAAMQRHPMQAGSASALLGTLQFLFGAVAARLVGILDDGTALPIGILMVAGAVAAKACEMTRPRSG